MIRFSNDGITWSAWQIYDSNYSNWDITDPAYGGNLLFGEKTVYAQIRDSYGNESAVYQQTATYLASPVIYVDAGATGNNNGSDWQNAFNSPQDGLALAVSGETILVAAGTYTPDIGSGLVAGDQEVSFTLISGVEVYGGFPEGGGTFEERDPVNYETILSGDLNSDDEADFVNYDENSIHVVVGVDLDNTTILDGFTIQGGNGTNNLPGGGMYLALGNPQLVNCVFKNNRADSDGGGLYIFSSSPEISLTNFVGNSAEDLGGGMYIYGADNPIISNSVFSGNTAQLGGGAAHYAGSASFLNCSFSGNSASQQGGAIYFDRTQNAILLNSVLWSNSAPLGPQLALMSDGTHPLEVWFSLIEDDEAGIYSIGDEQYLWEEGNFSSDPFFVDGLLHLAPISPAIDRGCTSGDNCEYANEPPENGGRINQGAYGNTSEAAVSDPDEDGFLNPSDNCPLQPNSDQADQDNDLFGDVCDPCPADSDLTCNTPMGDNAAVVDEYETVAVSFLSSLENGVTSFTVNDCDTVQTVNVDLPNTPQCVWIETEVTYEGNIEICLSWLDKDITNENDFAMIQCDTEANCRILETIYQDNLTNTLCAQSAELSWFVLGFPNDSDSDGVFDFNDNCTNTANLDQTDTDLDGMGDVCDTDDDGDGILDGSDNCPLQFNSDQADSDSDLSGDVCDSCPFDADNDIDGDGICGDTDNCLEKRNVAQLDSDGDTIGDSCDICPFDADNDYDGDGLCADQDNCPLTVNSDQADSDNDNTGDLCDICSLDYYNDYDDDTICGDTDNCPAVANIAQIDSDSDGIGDLCDLCPYDPNNDVDKDSLCADTDNCPTVWNMIQTDTDEDGFGNICDTDDDNDNVVDQNDNCIAAANANQLDSDGDQAGDACDRDADGDGYEGPLGNNDDCNDNDDTVYPGAVEICDQIDNNCDGQVNENLNCPGDINADGVVDLVDVILSLQILTQNNQSNNLTLTGDVDNDQNIGMAEAIYGLRSAAEL